MGESALVQELASTRGALRDATAIGEKLQARIDAAREELASDERQLTDAELLAVLEGKR